MKLQHITHMIYISENNIYKRCNILGTISNVFNDTEYLPVRTCDDILLMSDGKLYTIARDNKLSVLKLKHGGNYTVDSADFTNEFAKINLPGDSDYYEICEMSLCKIPIVANNSCNIKRVCCKSRFHYYFYYYVNINNELVVFDTSNKSEQHKILDNNISLILYFSRYGEHIIYIKNNAVIYSKIKHFAQLTNSYVIDYVGQSIIKSSYNFVLDSHNDLYELIMTGKKFVAKKISSNIVNVFCDAIYVYTIDTESKIHSIRYDYIQKYIDIGHFGKKFSNTKSANYMYKQT